jgi:uncharacterized protein (DUF433 family)
MNSELLKRIAIDPNIRSGKPCIKGTRITVADILHYLAGGMTKAQILDDFPDLQEKDILAALEYAACQPM